MKVLPAHGVVSALDLALQARPEALNPVRGDLLAIRRVPDVLAEVVLHSQVAGVLAANDLVQHALVRHQVGRWGHHVADFQRQLGSSETVVRNDTHLHAPVTLDATYHRRLSGLEVFRLALVA